MDDIWIVSEAPEAIDDLIAPERIKEILSGYAAAAERGEAIPNFTLYSVQPGVGKTTAARTLFHQAGYDVHMFNGSKSDERGIHAITEKIEPLVLTVPFDMRRRAIIIDEADNLTKDAQKALREVINKAGDIATFVLTCNYIDQLIEPLLSRCPVINYEYDGQDDRQKALKALSVALIKAAKKRGWEGDKSVLVDIAVNNFPDIRKAFNDAQTFVQTGSVRSIKGSMEEVFESLFEVLKDGNFQGAIRIMGENDVSGVTPAAIKWFADRFEEEFGEHSLWASYPLAAKYLDMASRSLDREIVLKGFLKEVVELIREMESVSDG